MPDLKPDSFLAFFNQPGLKEFSSEIVVAMLVLTIAGIGMLLATLIKKQRPAPACCRPRSGPGRIRPGPGRLG